MRIIMTIFCFIKSFTSEALPVSTLQVYDVHSCEVNMVEVSYTCLQHRIHMLAYVYIPAVSISSVT